MRPQIGITASRVLGPDGVLHADVRPYVAAVRRAGGEAVVFSNDEPVDAALARVDGVLLSGGVDVDPARYGAVRHPKTQASNAARDAFELALVRATRARDIPTLCICRGLQVANVAFGGTLIQHLPGGRATSSSIDHRQLDERGVERSEYARGHVVTLDADSALARLVGATCFPTNSIHHQAAGAVASTLRVVGCTPDETIEALAPAFPHPFFHAVQWHPEELDDAVSAALFGGLVSAARGAPLERA